MGLRDNPERRIVDGPDRFAWARDLDKAADYDPDAAPFREAYLRGKKPRLSKGDVKRGRPLEK